MAGPKVVVKSKKLPVPATSSKSGAAPASLPMGNQLAGRTANKTMLPLPTRSAAGKAYLASKPANTTARNRRSNAAAASASGPRGPQRPVGENSRMAAKAAPARVPVPPKQGGKSPLDLIGDWLDQNIPSRRASEVVTGAMKNPTPVIPYTQQNVKAIQKAKR